MKEGGNDNVVWGLFSSARGGEEKVNRSRRKLDIHSVVGKTYRHELFNFEVMSKKVTPTDLGNQTTFIVKDIDDGKKYELSFRGGEVTLGLYRPRQRTW